MSKSKKRAVAPAHGDVGGHRYTVYAKIREQIDSATNDGYSLEAITLIESLLADRLESRAGYLTEEDHGFSTLGKLIGVLRGKGVEMEPGFREIFDQIDRWRERRNAALHELPKFEEGRLESWEQRIAALPHIVVEGQQLLYRLAALDEQDRAGKPGVRPPATAPNVFAAWRPKGA